MININSAYYIDRYRSHSLVVTVYFNISRRVIGFTARFWIPPLIAVTNYGLGVGVLAIICFFFQVLVGLASGIGPPVITFADVDCRALSSSCEESKSESVFQFKA